MDYTEKLEKPHILPLEWNWGFEGMVRVERSERTLRPDTGGVARVIHPGSFRAPISGFRRGFPSSTGNDAKVHGKYRLKRLFLENIRFKRILTVQNSGLLRASFSYQ
jgi:hypothetical protein